MKVVMYDGTSEERRMLVAQHMGSKTPFHTLITHYDHVMRDKGVLKRVSVWVLPALLV